jgi:hypothetical protein
MIRQHEWLGTTGGARIFFGLRSAIGELLAVVGFGHGPHAASQKGELVLVRGCTMPWAPRNAATFLIGRALRALRKLGHRMFKAFTDPVAGETGAIYRALGWRSVVPAHPWRYELREGGRQFCDREIYRRFGSHEAARAAGATIVRTPRRTPWVAP